MFVDLRHAIRSLRRSPASAAAAVVALSLTLGAGVSIAALVEAVLLTPPPFVNPESLVTLGEQPIGDDGGSPRAVAYATFEDWRERAASIAHIEAFDGTNLTLTGIGHAERISATDVTTGFLAMLGAPPARGRIFDSGDVGRPVAIVSDAFWRTTLATDPEVIGRQITLGERPHTIVGVLSERFSFALNGCDIWRPLPVTPAEAARAGYRVLAVARLHGKVSPVALAATLDDVSGRSTPPARAVATPIAQAIAGDATLTIVLLAGSAALVFIIAFTNLATLLIVRAIDRRRELAVRTALGARRREIAWQLILESQAIAFLGLAGGVLLAVWMTPVVTRLTLEQFGALATREVTVTWRVAAVMALLAAGCAAICGSVPAFLAVRNNFDALLRRGATASARELALRRVLVAGEVAATFVLLVCVTLLGGSLRRVLAVAPGFAPDGVLALQISLPGATYPTPQNVASFYATLERALEERLGRGAVSIVSELPLTGDGGRRLVGARPSELSTEAIARDTTAGYFDVMRIPVIDGRPFSARDDASAPARVVVSETLARRMFGSVSPVGQPLWLARAGRPAEIIGVVGDVKHRTLDEVPLPTVYRPALQSPSPSSIVVVRSNRPVADVVAAVREEVVRLDANLPVYRARLLTDVVDSSPGVPARRVLLLAFAGFALLALVLGTLGLFGVVAHDVARRRAELALRLALGADPRHLLTATLRQSVVMVGSGLAIGAVLSFWAAPAIGSLLFATSRWDAVSVGIVALLLLAAGLCATLPAAVRAARTDPLTALRAE